MIATPTEQEIRDKATELFQNDNYDNELTPEDYELKESGYWTLATDLLNLNPAEKSQRSRQWKMLGRQELESISDQWIAHLATIGSVQEAYVWFDRRRVVVVRNYLKDNLSVLMLKSTGYLKLTGEIGDIMKVVYTLRRNFVRYKILACRHKIH